MPYDDIIADKTHTTSVPFPFPPMAGGRMRRLGTKGERRGPGGGGIYLSSFVSCRRWRNGKYHQFVCVCHEACEVCGWVCDSMEVGSVCVCVCIWLMRKSSCLSYWVLADPSLHVA